MTMDEFNRCMQVNGCRYSINVLLGLNQALAYVPRINKYNKRIANCQNSEVLNEFKAYKRELQDSMNKTMITTLIDALTEKRDGLIYEEWLQSMSFSQIQFINPIITKWAPILRPYGVELQTY